MTTAPIRTALDLMQTAMLAALAPLVPTFKGSPAVYWQQAPSGVASALLTGDLAGCIVCQAQDGGGHSLYYLGVQGWRGLVTVKCMAVDRAAATALLASIPEPLTLTASVYALAAEWQRPLDLPTVDGITTAAGIYRLTINHA